MPSRDGIFLLYKYAKIRVFNCKMIVYIKFCVFLQPKVKRKTTIKIFTR